MLQKKLNHWTRPIILLPAMVCWLIALEIQALDYPAIDIANMLMESDVVVKVQLPQTVTNPYLVVVESVINGELTSEKLNVFEPAYWRGTEPVFYTRQALLFLIYNSTADRWEVSGPSGEGRIVLDGEYAYAGGIAIPGGKPESYVIGSKKIHALRYPQVALLDALGNVGRCFDFEHKNAGDTKVITRCEDKEIERLRLISPLYEHLIEKMRIELSDR